MAVSIEMKKTANNHSIILIAGTDTGVGKTWTGCALALALRRVGRNVTAVKPMETGCPESPSGAEDGVRLALATGQTEPLHALMRFRDPVAPPEAADREGRRIDFNRLVRRIREYAERSEITLVEGAGGLLSPLTWNESAVDLARTLEARVLLVAADRLGTINHVLMSLKILEWNRLDILGLVLTAPPAPDASTGSNAAAIFSISGYRRLVSVPRTPDPTIMADSIQGVVQWLPKPKTSSIPKE